MQNYVCVCILNGRVSERKCNEFKHFTCMSFLFVLELCVHSEMSPIVKLCTIADDAVGKLSTGNEQFSYNFIHSNGIYTVALILLQFANFCKWSLLQMQRNLDLTSNKADQLSKLTLRFVCLFSRTTHFNRTKKRTPNDIH